MEKLEKQQAGYLYRPETHYVCGECVFQKELPKGKAGCALFGPSETISLSKGSCDYFSHGHRPKPEVPWLGVWTKIELGYFENEGGFSCKRCEEFLVGKNDCKKVDKDSEGDTPGIISANGCCSNWERDPIRGGASDERLVQILAAPVEKRPENGKLEKVFRTLLK
jgi:hypothetical protein